MSINREATIRWKGYDPETLTPRSTKRVWANCDKCEQGRWTNKHDYRALCSKCAADKYHKEMRATTPQYNKGVNAPFYGHRHTEKVKKRIGDMCRGESHSMYNKSPSLLTRQRMSAAQQGIAHIEWVDFKYNTATDLSGMRNHPENVEWRNAVFERDNFTCQQCGHVSEGDIQAHHIYMWSIYPELRLDVDNGITLCTRCHEAVRGYEDEYIDMFIMLMN